MASEEQAQPQSNAVPAPVAGVPMAVESNTPAPIPTGLTGIWSKIKRHKVVEWSVAYIAFGYAILHGSEMVREAFDWSALVPRLTLVALLLGFPVALTLAWYHGHRAQHRVSRIEIAILAALLVVAGSVLWAVSRSSHDRTTAPAASSASATTTTIANAGFSPPAHSVAVLPFTNLSGDPQEEYFSDGMSEELINALTQIDSLQVIARTSSFSFKGQNVDIETIGRKLNAGAILEGSIRRVGNTVRITAQLINARDGIHIWSQDYDRELTNVLVLQSEIATVVAQQLQAKLLGDEAAKIEEGGTHDPRAYDAILRGRQTYASAKNEQDYRKVIEATDEAIAADPQYADAYTLKNSALGWLARFYARSVEGRSEDSSEALEAGRHAVMLAPNQGEAHAVLANAMSRALDFSGALPEFNRAVSLSPGNADVQDLYGVFQSMLGHRSDAFIASRRAIALDPQNPRHRSDLAVVLRAARRPSEALTALQDADSLAPGSHLVGYLRWHEYLLEGRFDLMTQFCEKADSPLDEDSRPECLAFAYHGLGNAKQAQEQLEKFETLDGDFSAYQYARVYAQFGQTRDAINWLVKAERLRDPFMIFIRIDPELDPIRDEPTFKALVRRLNFPP